jgi:hypothetical protein
VSNSNLPANLLPTKHDELLSLTKRLEKGDKTALPAFRELLNDPHVANALGNLASHAQHTLIRKFAPNSLTSQEAISRKLGLLKTELGGPNPDSLEAMLVERIVACWLHLYHLELVYAGNDSMSLDVSSHYQRCIDRAHKRYLSAIKTLATVRKLALPVLQVNIAKKQVNVAGTCVNASPERVSS